MHGIAKVAVAAALVVFAAGTASADVTINEMKVKSTEYIELYNSGGSDVDVTDWTLDDGSGPEVLAGVVPAGGFLVIDTILTLNNGGAIVELRDATGALIDDVGYGNMGGAPLGFNSIGRSPDGDDTDDWARDFEYADDNLFAAPETPGEPNIQGEPALGSGIIINELDPYGTGNPDEFDRLSDLQSSLTRMAIDRRTGIDALRRWPRRRAHHRGTACYESERAGVARSPQDLLRPTRRFEAGVVGCLEHRSTTPCFAATTRSSS
jgi:hypothetical protein